MVVDIHNLEATREAHLPFFFKLNQGFRSLNQSFFVLKNPKQVCRVQSERRLTA